MSTPWNNAYNRLCLTHDSVFPKHDTQYYYVIDLKRKHAYSHSRRKQYDRNQLGLLIVLHGGIRANQTLERHRHAWFVGLLGSAWCRPHATSSLSQHGQGPWRMSCLVVSRVLARANAYTSFRYHAGWMCQPRRKISHVEKSPLCLCLGVSGFKTHF